MSAMLRRPAYTLLEVLLAAAIGILLLGAVYVALDIHFTAAQGGRDVVEQATLARSVLSRMGDDITLSLGTIDPSRYRSSRGQSGSGGGSSGSAPSSGGSTQNQGSTTPNTTATPSDAAVTTTPTTTTTTTDVSGAVKFNLFVQGDATALTLYISRVPRELNGVSTDDLAATAAVLVSDLRRVTYWLAGNEDAPLGLARQEVKIATSERGLEAPGAPLDEEADYIVEEVRSLRFSYFDGTDWLESWDGSALGSDGKTPLGPPRAIAIEIEVAPPNSSRRSGEEVRLQRYRHVVSIPVANGAPQTAQQTTTTAP